MAKQDIKEMDRLVANVNPRAKLPRGFELWSFTLQMSWLRQNQRKDKKPMDNVLHDLDNPVKGGQRFERWHALLVHVEKNKVTGYAVDSLREVVRFRNGKRKDTRGKWQPAAGGQPKLKKR